MSENEDTKISKSEIREIKQQLSKIQKILESDAFNEKLDFIETHNKIIKSLSEAEKGHAKTLNSFLEELQKRIAIINELNTTLAYTNTTANNLNSKLNDYINLVNAAEKHFVQCNRELSSYISKAGDRWESAAYRGVGKILRYFKNHMFINTAFNFLILLILSFVLYALLKK